MNTFAVRNTFFAISVPFLPGILVAWQKGQNKAPGSQNFPPGNTVDYCTDEHVYIFTFFICRILLSPVPASSLALIVYFPIFIWCTMACMCGLLQLYYVYISGLPMWQFLWRVPVLTHCMQSIGPNRIARKWKRSKQRERERRKTSIPTYVPS